MIVGLDVKSKVMWCGICSNEVRAKYYRIDEHNKIICNKCYERGTRCQVCLLPSFNIYAVSEVRVCAVCYSRKDKCLSCRTPINNDRKYELGIQGFFCSSCYRLSKKCSRCSFPAINDSILKVVDKELLLCSGCASYSVIANELASTIFRNIRMLLARQTGIHYDQELLPVVLSLVSGDRMKESISRNAKKIRGQELKGLLVYSFSRNNKHFIYSLVGLPLRTFISGVTYEYSRIIAFKYCGSKISKGIKEGFASWLSINLLCLLGYHEEVNKTNNLSITNSFGFRKIKLIERSNGINGVMDFIKDTKNNKVVVA